MSKEKYCARILNSYYILVDYEGDAHRINAPSPLEEPETIAHWKQRVLGNDVSDVKIYFPMDFPGNTLISTIQNKIDSWHVEKVFNNLRKEKNDEIKALKTEKEKEKTIAVDNAVKQAEIKFTTFSKDTLEKIIENLDITLEKPVDNFLEKYMQENSDVKTEEMIEKLVRLYNEAARQFRLLDQKHQTSNGKKND